MLPSGRGEKAALRGLSGSPGISDDIFDMDATYDLAVQNRFHSVSRPLKLLHFSTSHEIVLGWLTQVGKSHFYIREGVQKKHAILGRFLPNVGGWGGSQTRSKPLKKNQISLKIAFFDVGG